MDFLKSKPYWLKGGIIGVGLYVILSIIAFSSPMRELANIGDALSVFGYVFVKIFVNIFSGIGRGYGAFLLVIIFSSVIYFIIGAFVGWVIGKIKSKKVSDNTMSGL